MKNKILLVALILSLGFFVFSVVRAQGTTSTGAPTNETIDASGITFPVPELGNCVDKDACRSYCDQPGNMLACISFAKTHGLMNGEDTDRAQKYVEDIKNKQTPGGCTDPQSCNTYCEETSHLDECLSFAKKHGLSDDNIKQGEQIKNYLAQGGKMPGGCTSRSTCDTYCSNFSHAQECLAFAKSAGFLKKIAADQGLSEEKLQTLVDLTSSGNGPGGCQSKDQCESYCKDQSHMAECVDFGVKAGFITQDQADKVKKIGGKGPGGCSSETACKDYCSDPTHQEECFKFGEENGLIPQEDLKAAKEGIVRLKVGLENAPPEIKACLTSVLGADNIAKIQAGTFTPGPGLGEQMKQCAGKFKESFNSEDAFKGAPPEVAKCLKEKLGDSATKLLSGQTAPDASTADVFRVCMGQNQIMQEGSGRQGMPDINQFLNGVPPEVQACIKDKLGSDFADKLAKGEVSREDMQGKMQDCFKSFRPQSQRGEQNESPGGLRGGSEQRNGFTECGITDGAVAAYVCGINGSSRGAQTGAGVETTYFNECHAKQQGAQILHSGVCVRNGKPDVPCSDIAHPVCGTDGNSWTNECNAKEAGAGVKHEGVCTNENRGQNNAGQTGQADQETGGPRGILNAPPTILECLKSKLSAENFAKLQNGDTSVAKDAIQSCVPSNTGPGMLPKLPERKGFPILPVGGSAPSAGAPVPSTGSVPPTGMMPQIDCAQFVAVSSCDFVPSGIARDMCEKCKGN